MWLGSGLGTQIIYWRSRNDCWHLVSCRIQNLVSWMNVLCLCVCPSTPQRAWPPPLSAFSSHLELTLTALHCRFIATMCILLCRQGITTAIGCNHTSISDKLGMSTDCRLGRETTLIPNYIFFYCKQKWHFSCPTSKINKQCNSMTITIPYDPVCGG